MVNTIILRTNEICLKGRNRHLFERVLVADVRRRLAPVGDFKVRADQGSVFAVYHNGALNAEQRVAAEDAVRTVFGIAAILFAARVERADGTEPVQHVAAIADAACALMQGRGKTTFKVFASRTDKSFGLPSQEVAAEVGGQLLDRVEGLVVDVREPRTRVAVEIAKGVTYVAVGRIEGAGGLPGGYGGKVVALLSGGIDSPVATWKLMRRGCRPVLVHFHSYPYVGRASIEKVRRLADRLGAYLPDLTLYMVPIGDAQREITVKADESMRVLLYRRLMFRIAEKIARQEEAKAIVTGDSVGQVASQTLHNIEAVSAAVTVPVFRPLIGDDKEDIVAVAKKIGTYATSIEPHDDCCSLFVPRAPATKARVQDLDAEEAKYDVAALMADALAKTEIVTVAATQSDPPKAA